MQRKSLCRVAVGIAGFTTKSDVELEQIVACESKNLISVVYRDIIDISLSRDMNTNKYALSMDFAKSKPARRFLLDRNQFDLMRVELPKIAERHPETRFELPG
jgi:hypothetical protein